MPRGATILATLLVSASALTLTQTAGATTFCVGVADPGCTAMGTVQAALTAASTDPDPTSTVEISQGTTAENNLNYPGPSHPGHVVELVGSSDGTTILTHSSGDPHPVIGCAAGALTLRDLGVRAANGSTFPGVTGAAGCAVTLDGVTVDMSVGTGNGVELLGGGAIRNSTVTSIATGAQPVAVLVNTAVATTISDSTITGGNALVDLGAGAITAHRLKLSSTGAGNAAVTVQAAAGSATLTIDDSLIRTSAGSQALFATSSGADTHVASLTGRQLTAVVDDATAALPFHTASTGGSATITVFDTVASGYTQGVRLDGGGTGAIIELHHTAMTSPNSPSVKTGTATYTHADDVIDVATHTPKFVSPATSDFHLGTGSLLIDEDTAALAPGESTTDLFGHPRIVNAKRDIGAIEHQPSTGVATVPTTGKIGQEIGFVGSAVGDAGAPTVTWDFGDGIHGTGLAGSHIYTQPGVYHWQMILGDGTTLPVALAGTITVSAQPPTAVTLVADQISAVGALLHGTVDPGGGPTSYYFEYGPSPTYGAQTPAVTAGTGVGPVTVSAELTGLAADRLYHERLVAMHGAVVAYGDDLTFHTTAAAVAKTSTSTSTSKTTIAAGARCRVPHLVGKTLRQAHALLVRAHCTLGTVTHRHVKRHRNRVLRQARVAGHSYARDTAVAITVGRA